MRFFGVSQVLSRFAQLIGQYDKLLLAFLAVVVVISGSLWFNQFSSSKSDPTAGGAYVEGVVGDKSSIQEIAARLTKTGLLTFDLEGKIQNQLVEAWGVSPDQTTYQFTLLPGLNSSEFAEVLERNLSDVGATVEAKEQNQLVINLSQANPNLPLYLTKPLFDYGPYKLAKATDKTTIFTRNTKEHAARAYLNKIIIHSYANESILQKEAERGRFDGVMAVGDLVAPDEYSYQSINFPRYYSVLYNLNRSPLRDQNFRVALTDEKSIPPTPFSLTVVNQEPYLTLANQLIGDWEEAGAKVSLDPQSFEEISNRIVPNRNFQALLTGIDYGLELDPYYLWHSSQIRPPGNNLTGLKNDQIDTLIDQVRTSRSVPQRLDLITQLHLEIERLGVGKILKQEGYGFIVSNNIRFTKPWLSVTPDDRFEALANWSVK